DPLVPLSQAVYDPKDPTVVVQPDLGVPTRAHWVVTDLTDVPGDWYPRRPDWADVLVKQIGTSSDAPDVAAVLQSVTLSPEIKSFALADLPFGVWQQKPGCDLSAQKRVSDFSGANRPQWMDVANPPGDAPVYMQAPAAAVFTTVCINCHGPQADSHGL